MSDQLHTALKELAPERVPTPDWSEVESKVGRARVRYRVQVGVASVGAVILAGAAVFGLSQVNPGDDVINQPESTVPNSTPTSQVQIPPEAATSPTTLGQGFVPAVPFEGIQDPLEAVQLFLDGIATSNWDVVEGMLSDDSRSLYNAASELAADQQNVRVRWGFSGERFEVIELNETTRVVVIGEYAEDYIDFTAAVTLVFENGGWFVELDSSTASPAAIQRPDAFDPFQLIELEPGSTVEWQSFLQINAPIGELRDVLGFSIQWSAFFDDEELETSTVVSETSLPHVSISTLPDFDPDGGPYFLTLVQMWQSEGELGVEAAVFAVNQPPGVPQTSDG